MEEFKKEIKELEETIKATLETATAKDNLEQLKAKFELAKADFNKFGGQTADKVERFKKWATLETTYFYFRDKLASKIFEIVEQKTKKALEELTTADEELCYILNNNLYYYASKEHQETQRTSNKLTSIYLQLKELLEG